MYLRLCARRPSIILNTWRPSPPGIYERQLALGVVAHRCRFSSNSWALLAASSNTTHDFLSEYKKSYVTGSISESFYLGDSQNNKAYIGKCITVHGFLGKRKDLSEKLSFAQLTLAGDHDDSGVQVVSRVEGGPVTGPSASQDVHQKLKDIKPHSAVCISAVLELKRQPRGKDLKINTSEKFSKENIELVLQDISCLAVFPEDIIISENVQFGPENRHLQLRFDPDLKKRLKFRDRVLRDCRTALKDFQEIETPILFKSTPEGAREFLVPTRRPGYVYALPQSPQQYKQILMASGVHRYFQIAKCFRDEDLRADRQPEFTQVDLEMAFSDGNTVMNRMENFIYSLFIGLQRDGLVIPPPTLPFLRMTYHEAMHKYGSDKPDLRIPDVIRQVDKIIPKNLIGMLTSLSNPIVESWKIHLNENSSAVRCFVKEFMDSPEAIPFRNNPDGAPGIFVYDPRKPLEGLQAFGHEGAESLKEIYARPCTSSCSGPKSFVSIQVSDESIREPFVEGDLIIVQARPRVRFSGGSTALGQLRTTMYRAAVSNGLISPDARDYFLWVTDFPLFTPNNETNPGQGGSAGFSATHHPFTAPKTVADVDLLFTDPLEAIADHYDLVVNGVELGGGSRRIHNSEMQRYVMKDVLKMSEERLVDFHHLFEVLRAGCPPHAGMALGLDRLVAIMLGVDSVKDVIAFPKSGKGEDLLVKSPSRMTREQQETYHLTVVE